MVSPATRHLVAEWLRYAGDARVVTDLPNQMGLPDLDGFIDHRFDQSILSNLIYKLDLEIAAAAAALEADPDADRGIGDRHAGGDAALRQHCARHDLDGEFRLTLVGDDRDLR